MTVFIIIMMKLTPKIKEETISIVSLCENIEFESELTVFLKSKGYTLIGSICSGQDDVYLHNSLIELTNEFTFFDEDIIWTKQ